MDVIFRTRCQTSYFEGEQLFTGFEPFKAYHFTSRSPGEMRERKKRGTNNERESECRIVIFVRVKTEEEMCWPMSNFRLFPFEKHCFNCLWRTFTFVFYAFCLGVVGYVTRALDSISEKQTIIPDDAHFCFTTIVFLPFHSLSLTFVPGFPLYFVTESFHFFPKENENDIKQSTTVLF